MLLRLIEITDTMLDLFELLRGADNTQRLWELVQQPGAIEVLMHSANTPQVLLCFIDTTLLSYIYHYIKYTVYMGSLSILLNPGYNKLMQRSYIFC